VISDETCTPRPHADLEQRRLARDAQRVGQIVVGHPVRRRNLRVALAHPVEELDLRDVEALQVDVLRFDQLAVEPREQALGDDVRQQHLARQLGVDPLLHERLEHRLGDAVAPTLHLVAGLQKRVVAGGSLPSKVSSISRSLRSREPGVR
jgi:hypothetical protein